MTISPRGRLLREKEYGKYDFETEKVEKQNVLSQSKEERKGLCPLGI